MGLADTRGRLLRDLRISVTDRCNFRCSYCMPRDAFGHDHRFLDRKELLTFEELERIAGILVEAGVTKIRLTGGEPLLRRDVERLVARLAPLPGLADLAMTTNGVQLPEHAAALRAAGLHRLTVSLDALDDRIFARMNDVGVPASRVLAGITAAERAGFGSIRINTVIRRGVNEDQILPLARHFRETGHVVRFIEYMDVGHTNGWRLDEVVPAAEVLERIDREMPLEPLEPSRRGEVAERWRYREGGGEIGVIASVTRPFCGDCTRLRLSADGSLYTCLFATRGHDLRALVRGGATDEEIAGTIGILWKNRDDRYSEIRSAETVRLPKVEMSYIGG